MTIKKHNQKNTTLNKSRLAEAVLRKDFYSFLEKAFKELHGGSTMIPCTYIKVIAEYIPLILNGECRRLNVNLPPRSLKSLSFSVVFVAFALGIDPTLQFICVSYNQDLADYFGTLTLKLMQSKWFKILFPNTRIDKQVCSKGNFMTTKGGGRFATSIEGTLTGRGADVIIIDDPIKPDEALSDLQRNKVNRWFGSTLISRLNNKKKGVIINVMQRIHEDDLTGYLLSQPGKWKCLKFSAIATRNKTWKLPNGKIFKQKKGELLAPKRECLNDLLAIKESIGSYYFSSQYQQEPEPFEGALLKRSSLKYYTELPRPSSILVSWDTACKTGETNSYTVGTVWFVIEEKQRKYYLTNVFRDKLEYKDLLHKVILENHRLSVDYPGIPIINLIEEKSSGIQLIQELQQSNLNVRASNIDSNKIYRLRMSTIFFERGQVLLPQTAPWLDEYIKELLSFPNSRFDDQVDSTTQALLWLNYGRTARQISYVSPDGRRDFVRRR